jgi:hypothetical protein
MVWASQKNEEVYTQEMELQFLRATTNIIVRYINSVEMKTWAMRS